MSPCNLNVWWILAIDIMIRLRILVPMYIESVPNRNSPPCILLRQDHREGKKVVKETLANLTKWPKHIRPSSRHKRWGS